MLVLFHLPEPLWNFTKRIEHFSFHPTLLSSFLHLFLGSDIYLRNAAPELIVLQSTVFIEVSWELSLSPEFPQKTFLSAGKTVALHHWHDVNNWTRYSPLPTSMCVYVYTIYIYSCEWYMCTPQSLKKTQQILLLRRNGGFHFPLTITFTKMFSYKPQSWRHSSAEEANILNIIHCLKIIIVLESTALLHV